MEAMKSFGNNMKMKKIFSIVVFFVMAVLPSALMAQTGAQTGITDRLDRISQRSDLLVTTDMVIDGLTFTEGNSIRLLKSGHDKFEDLFKAVKEAKSFIHLEYFNFRNDSIANLLFDVLADKVREGVEVRAMYDAFGNMSNNQPISRHRHDSIANLGIKLVKFDPLNFPWINHIIPRDHRKIVVIDGRIAYTGGMNVADYYITGTPVVGARRDMHMHIEGPAVNELHKIFCAMWYKLTKELLYEDKYFPQPILQPENMKMAVVDRCPNHTNKSIRRLYTSMLNHAQHKIVLINPYFVPTHKVRSALKHAIDRGVDVQIMLSSRSDIPLTPDASYYVANNLMKRGAKLYLYEGGFHHTKAMMVDSLFCTVGSSNLDSRSLRCDYEVNTLIMDPRITRELLEMFNEDKKNSTEIHPGWWKKRKFGAKFRGWFANLLTPVL